MNKNSTILFILPIIIIIDLFLKLIPLDILFPIIILFQFYFLNKFENAFVLILFMGNITGAYFISRGASGVGGVFIIIGILLIWKEIIKLKFSLFKEYLPLLIILVSFGISAFVNMNGIDYDVKFFKIFITATLSFITFSVFLSKAYKIRFKLLGVVFLILGAFMLRLVIDINDLQGPLSFFHYGFMRDQTNIYLNTSNVMSDDFIISYHTPGFLALIGIVFIMFSNNFKFTLLNIFLFFISFIIIYYTGARQNLFGYILLVLFFLSTHKKYSYYYKFYLLTAFITVIGLALKYTKSDLLENILYSDNISSAIEAGGRSLHFLEGINYFLKNHLTGIGIGYHNYGNNARWPHNLFIEILAEVGILGLLIVLLALTFSIVRNRINKKINTRWLLLIVPFFIRSMISGSLTTNVIIFSFVCSIYFWPSNYTKKYD